MGMMDTASAFATRGFALLPGLLDAATVARLRAEVAAASQVNAPEVLREAGGAVRTVFSLHDRAAATGQPGAAALARDDALLGTVRALLGHQDIYIYHSKANLKPALEGSPFLWHQDYGYWVNDAVPAPRLLTMAVLLEAADDLSGCLYFAPGSHREGLLAHETRRVGGFEHFTVRADLMRARLQEGPRPEPLAGPAGTVALFDSLVCHASGHNLSGGDRTILYVTYNRCDNAPTHHPATRPSFVSARDTSPLPLSLPA